MATTIMAYKVDIPITIHLTNMPSCIMLKLMVLLETGVIELKYCPTEHMVADVLSKALARDRHQRLMMAFGVKGFGSTQSGSVKVDGIG